jgi:cytochrome c oxidase subunit I+III
MLVTALMMVVAFPPLILGSILLETERAFGLPFFDPTRGGDALLWQHLFWFFGHPDVYIILLPMAGLLSTMIPVFADTPLVGYRSIVVAIIGLAFVSFGIWVHHMFTVGIPHLALAFFSAGSAMSWSRRRCSCLPGSLRWPTASRFGMYRCSTSSASFRPS